MGIDSQGTKPNREEHNFKLSWVYQYLHAFTRESEFNMQAQAVGSGSNLFAWLFLIKPGLDIDLHYKKMEISKIPWNSVRKKI